MKFAICPCRLAIVITDGASRYPAATLDEAAALREHGIKIIAVGIKVNVYPISLFQHVQRVIITG